MKNLRKKMKKQGGFTLVEMLIVVAIIAILVAVSIPLVNSSLEKARRATDAANERAAKAAATIEYLTAETPITDITTYKYDAAAGILKASDETVAGYGKCSAHKDGVLEVTITVDGDVTINWTGDGVTETCHDGDVVTPLTEETE